MVRDLWVDQRLQPPYTVSRLIRGYCPEAPLRMHVIILTGSLPASPVLQGGGASLDSCITLDCSLRTLTVEDMEKTRKHEALMIIPTYNEAENIEALIRAIQDLKLPLDILVVDDASPDGTGDIVEGLRDEFENLFVTHRPGKMGLGTAYIAGFRYALANGYGIIMTMDSDFSHHPRYIPDLFIKRKDYDVVIGSRYVPGGGIQNWSLVRQGVSFVANKLAEAILGFVTRDNTSGFRLYNRRVLQSLHFDQIQSNGYSFLVEILYLCKKKRFEIGEVPILFNDRRVGKSKISKTEIIKAVVTLIVCGLDRLISVK